MSKKKAPPAPSFDWSQAKFGEAVGEPQPVFPIVTAPQDEQGNFSRGLEVAARQIPQTAGGALALVGDAAEKAGMPAAEAIKRFGLGVYQNQSDKINAITKDSDSFSNMMEGKTGVGDFAKYAAGYGTGQVFTALATGGAGGYVARKLAQRGITGLAAQEAEKLLAKKTMQGAIAAQGASNLMQETGSIYPEAVAQADAEGRQLTGRDLARVFGTGAVAALTDTAMDKIMASKLLSGSTKSGGMLSRVAKEVPSAMGREGVTEGIQTGLERFGAGKSLTDDAAIRDYVDSAGMGATIGGMGGALSGVRSKSTAQDIAPAEVPVTPTIEREAALGNAAAEQLRANKVTDNGPLSRSVNQGIEAEATKIDDAVTSQFVPHDDDLLKGVLNSLPSDQRGAFLQAVTIAKNPKALPKIRNQAAFMVDQMVNMHQQMADQEAQSANAMQPGQSSPLLLPAPIPSPEQVSQANLEAFANNREAMPLPYAQMLKAKAAELGHEVSVVPHPSGKGFSLVPQKYLTPAMQNMVQQGELDGALPAPTMPVPNGPLVANVQGDIRPQTYADQAAAREAQAQREVLGTQVLPGQPNQRSGVENVKTAPRDVSGQNLDAGVRGLQRSDTGRISVAELPNTDGNPTGAKRSGKPKSGRSVLGQDDPGATDRQRGNASDVAKPEFVNFKKELGSLGIPRDEMPQIKAEHRGAMVNFLNARGITHEQEEVDANSLKPTQKEFSPEKVKLAAKFKGGDRSILVSSDNHVVDGHHQWLAKLAKGKPVKVIRLNSPIKDLLPEVKAFPSAETDEGSSPKNEKSNNKGNTLFSRNESKSKSANADIIQKTVDNLTKNWKNSPSIEVIASMEDAPKPVADEHARQNSQGATGDIEGFFYAGKVYLVADSLAHPSDAARVLFHEALGHYGLRGLYGKNLESILDQITRVRRGEIVNKAKQYGLDPKSQQDMRIAAEEWLAEMAQSKPELGFVKRAVAAIRTFLRDIGMDVSMSDDEIIRDYILPARQFVERGGKVSGQGKVTFSRGNISVAPTSLGDTKFSRSTNAITETEAFKKWFGDSKVVDEEGKPLVVYHGSPSGDIRQFDGSKEGSNTGESDEHHGLGGFYFTPDANTADTYARTHEVEFANIAEQEFGIKPSRELPNSSIYPVYLAIKNPLIVADGLITKQVIEQAKKAGHDGVMKSGKYPEIVAFRPEQIKSATGNNGNFDPTNPDIRFSRATINKITTGAMADSWPNAAKIAHDKIFDLFGSTGRTFNTWQRTIGTQLGKARTNAEFGKVFNRAQQFIDDISKYAIRAEGLAPSILPNVGELSDVVKAFNTLKEADNQWLGNVLAAGTLNGDDPSPLSGKRFTDNELRNEFNANEKQVKLYNEARAAIDQSLDDAGKATLISAMRSFGLDREFLQHASEKDNLKDAATYASSLADDGQYQSTINGILKQTEGLKKAGYSPLMRFGPMYLTMYDKDGEVTHFARYESSAERLRDLREMQRAHPDWKHEMGRINTSEPQQFQGVSPDIVALFAEYAGLDKSEGFQEWYKLAAMDRSRLKRMIHRKGTAGFSVDAKRALAAFITSNSRYASSNLHFAELSKDVAAIKDGDTQEEAQKLADFVMKPKEEAAQLRGMMFTWFLGGSIASGLVNLTQPVMMTYPYLSQWGAGKAATAMKEGLAALRGNGNPELLEALKKAKNEGVTDPSEIYQLMAASQGKASSPFMQKFMAVWGTNFAVTESINRKLTYAAAYSLALREKMADPHAFAVSTIRDTQGLYSRANRPNWARGAVGSTLFTFKQYSIAYVEFLKQLYGDGALPKPAFLIAVGMLAMMSGMHGLPGADDLEDVIDSIGQWLGFSTNTRGATDKFLRDTMGREMANLLQYGVSSQMGIDLAGRMGMGNLIPGTGALIPSNRDKMRDVKEFAGPIAGLFDKGNTALEKLFSGDAWGALKAVAPNSVQNAAKGIEMLDTGEYRNTKGKKMQDVTAGESVAKMLGLQPQSVASETRAFKNEQRSIDIQRSKKQEWSDAWSFALANNNRGDILAVKAEIDAYNKRNPDLPVHIRPEDIRRRAAEIKKTRAERFMKSTPKELRGTIRENLQ